NQEYFFTVKDLLGVEYQRALEFPGGESKIASLNSVIGKGLANSLFEAAREIASQAGESMPPILKCDLKTNPNCAQDVLRRVASRAFRRPVKGNELSGLLNLFNKGETSGSYQKGLEAALSGILLSPQFLYRLEIEETPLASGEV